ncbi:protein phosphatase 1 regulatory subunit 3B isoform X1 [Microcaecilia unicolor]|uniref:Protein phosphatase 1 regulatory subunit n=1 Tax=Microcaecilia unicolor TaxID=1415580 RepID=A0A6P7XAK8_9AMPH|nr:protein phosphatase 1 regulatory subunit 3B isoform X1 [Microcaecilia unicolor]XP_030050341.1 protein phosphatase 1 regulatory subunit 3B isoform X1 [Microcaecilia unicolor]
MPRSWTDVCMSSTRVLDCFPHKPAMALDIAMQLYLHSPPLRRERFTCKIGNKPNKPLRPCIQLSSSKVNLDGPGMPAQHLPENKVKKRVSFADHRGLALTMVKVFSEFDDPLDIPFNISKLIDNIVGLSTVEKDSFVLDFAQPSADYLDFRNRLQAECVCLENCMLKDKAIVGTVKVKNLAFKKSVSIRMTFNTWKTFTDYECQYVKDTYAGSDRDTFSFDINLPERIQSHERLEFAVCFKCDGKVYWDSNKGQNYRIVRSELKSARETTNQNGPEFGISFDQYGSPRCSYGIFPEWPSYSGYEKLGPYY